MKKPRSRRRTFRRSPFSLAPRRWVQGLFLAVFLFLFFYTCWPYTAEPSDDRTGWPSHYADDLTAKEWWEAESFLALDPLVGISTALASKAWIWSLGWAAVILLVGVLAPRSFCSYVCPLGTTIDVFDAVFGKRFTRFRVQSDGWWRHLKYHILAATLAAAVLGVLLSGFVAAIPVLTRGLQFTVAPLQLGWMRGWHQVPPVDAGQVVSVALFFLVLSLGFLRPRFWCRHLCPTGAVFSVVSSLRVLERRVEGTCVECNKCVEVCSFGAIDDDFTTRTSECALCQSCGGVCPPGAIRYVNRWSRPSFQSGSGSLEEKRSLSRRGFLASTLSGIAAALGIRSLSASVRKEQAAAGFPVRPPMSLPEEQFLQACVRCDLCLKACPNNVIQPAGFSYGLDGLWTPRVVATWSGCEPSCNNCGQVCPTGAIRALPLEEKRAARMGLAIVDRETCLPWADRESCQLCVDECQAAGYDAIEFERVGVQIDEQGRPVEGTGYLAPVVVNDRCVGCGLCESACHRINGRHKGLLDHSAITVKAGPGREDRIATGSYVALRRREAAQREAAARTQKADALRELDDIDFGDL